MRSVYLGVCGDISFVTVSVTLLTHTVSYSQGGRLTSWGGCYWGVGDFEEIFSNLRGGWLSFSAISRITQKCPPFLKGNRNGNKN
jgi:hypothetical protein